MSAATAPELRIALADIALLAKVQRPVVSMWRSRSKNTAAPFPSPVDAQGSQELFDAAQVTDWLTATARGNNPHAADDAAAFAVLAGPDAKRRHFTGLTALLALRGLTDAPLRKLSAEDLLDSADEQDPDDAFLYAELEELGVDLMPLAIHADLLSDASYTAAAAFEQLLADRFRAGSQHLASTALSAEVLDLVASTALELAAGSNGPPVYMDDGGSDFLRSIADIVGEAEPAVLVVGTLYGTAARLARRRLLVHGLHKENLQIVNQLPARTEGIAVRLAQFPSPSFPDMDAQALLTAVDNIALEMTGSSAAVVLAPASVLTDPLEGGASAREIDAIRSNVLRSGRVRAIVRLPQGLLKSKPRQAQALWILGATRLDVPIADRWTMVADLTGQRLTKDIRQDLVSDLAASMGDRGAIRAHSFRFATLVLTRTLLANSGALTAAITDQKFVAVSANVASGQLVLTEELIKSLSGPKPEMPAIILAPGTNQALASASLASLLREGSVKYLPGHRLDDSHIAVEVPGRAQLRIIGPAELTDEIPAGTRRIDQLTFAASYPQGRLTEAGDVIFTTGAQGTAVVDEVGAAVVLYPARILRINATDPGGLLPQMLAQDLRNAPGGNWRQWPARRIYDGARPTLSGALAVVADERRRLAVRLQRLDELSGMLMDGAAHGSFRVLDLGMTTEGIS